MTDTLLKTSFKIGLVTAGLVVLYEITNLLLDYHYFKYEYYIAGAAILALLTGIILTNRYHREKAHGVDCSLLDSLTGKELRVLALMTEGKSNKEIAALN